MITFGEAKARAEETVVAIGASAGINLVIVHDQTVEVPEGWVFFYNSKEFVETRNFLSRLAGNGPIFVDRSGLARNLLTTVPWNEAIKRK